MKSARNKYGADNYTKHSSDVDHIIPLKVQHEHAKKNRFLSDSDVKEIANDVKNLQILSAKENRSKGVNQGRNSDVEKAASKFLHKAYAKRTVKNASETFHKSGVNGAAKVGSVTVATSGIANIANVINGEKTADEAVRDIAKDGVKSIAAGYLAAGSAKTIAQAFSKSSGRAATDKNVSGKVADTVLKNCDTVINSYLKLKKFGK